MNASATERLRKGIHEAFTGLATYWSDSFSSSLSLGLTILAGYVEHEKTLIGEKRLVSCAAMYPTVTRFLLSRFFELAPNATLQINVVSTMLPRHFWNIPHLRHPASRLAKVLCYQEDHVDAYRECLTEHLPTVNWDHFSFRRHTLVRGDAPSGRRGGWQAGPWRGAGGSLVFSLDDLLLDREVVVAGSMDFARISELDLTTAQFRSIYGLQPSEVDRRGVREQLRGKKIYGLSQRSNRAEPSVLAGFLAKLHGKGTASIVVLTKERNPSEISHDGYGRNIRLCPDGAVGDGLLDFVYLSIGEVAEAQVSPTVFEAALVAQLDYVGDTVKLRLVTGDQELRQYRNALTVFNRCGNCPPTEQEGAGAAEGLQRKKEPLLRLAQEMEEAGKERAIAKNDEALMASGRKFVSFADELRGRVAAATTKSELEVLETVVATLPRAKGGTLTPDKVSDQQLDRLVNELQREAPGSRDTGS